MYRKLLILLTLALVVSAGFAVSARDASAASQTINLSFSGSGGTHTWLTGEVICDPCLPDILHSGSGSWGIGGQVELDGQATWNPGPAPTVLQYSAGNLRHGATLDLTDTLTPQPGTVTINYSVPLTFGIYHTPGAGGSCFDPTTCSGLGWAQNPGEVTSTKIAVSDTIPCTMPLPGDSPRNCPKSFSIPIFSGSLFGIIGVDISLPITETVTVTGSGVTSVRVAAVGGGPAKVGPSTLTFGGSSPSTLADPIFISCSQPVGTDLLYSMTSNAYTADPMTWGGSVSVRIAASAFGFNIAAFNFTLVTLSGFTLGPVPMTAPNQTADLGPVQKNNIPPTVITGGPYSGFEGTPIQFDGSGSSSVCGVPKLTWNFSDGGVAYGVRPFHTFQDAGTYSGWLIATDPDGNVSTATFSVTVAQAPPVITPLPLVKTDRGVPVLFSAEAVSPGTADQPTLTYAWNFGDGTTALNQKVTHSYAATGTYTVTLTVSDDSTSATAQTTVTVNTHAPIVSPLPAPAKAVWGVPITFSGFATDPDGAPQDTLKYAWNFGDSPSGPPCPTPIAAACGNAVLNQKVTHTYIKPGTFTVTLTVTDRNGGSATQTTTVTVNKRHTAIKQCGDVQVPTGQRTVNDCGTVIDSQREPVIGRNVVFTLVIAGATITNSGVTDANGNLRTAFNANLPAGCFSATVNFPATNDNLYLPSIYNYFFYTSGNGGPQTCAFTSAGSASPTRYDVNCDGSVNSLDALYILQVVAGLTHFTSCGNVANVNGDGVIDSLDALVILRYVAGSGS